MAGEHFNFKKEKSPLFHIVRRTNVTWKRKTVVTAIAIVVALLLTGIIGACFSGGAFGDFYYYMVDGVFGTGSLFINCLWEAAILLLISVAITPAFKMKFWNIGAEGQVLMGSLGSAIMMYVLKDSVPSWALILICLVAAVVLSMIWGLIPAFFRARFKTNETLFTLMMNYVAMGLITTFIAIVQGSKGSGTLGILNRQTENGWLPQIFGQDYILNILIVIGITVIMYFYQNYTKHGYEINVVGGSYRTAKYVGINVKGVIVRTMILSAGLCGVCGFLLVNGASHTVNANLAGGRGFTAILVSWLSEFNPLLMVFYAFLVAFITKGSTSAGDAFQLGENFHKVIIGLFFFIIIASTFFLNYEIVLDRKLRRRKSKKQVSVEEVK